MTPTFLFYIQFALKYNLAYYFHNKYFFLLVCFFLTRFSYWKKSWICVLYSCNTCVSQVKKHTVLQTTHQIMRGLFNCPCKSSRGKCNKLPNIVHCKNWIQWSCWCNKIPLFLSSGLMASRLKLKKAHLTVHSPPAFPHQKIEKQRINEDFNAVM